MDAVGQDGQAGDGVDEDDLGQGGSGAGAGVDNSGVCHGLQPVQGNGGQTQGRDVDGNTLDIFLKFARTNQICKTFRLSNEQFKLKRAKSSETD